VPGSGTSAGCVKLTVASKVTSLPSAPTGPGCPYYSRTPRKVERLIARAEVDTPAPPPPNTRWSATLFPFSRIHARSVSTGFIAFAGNVECKVAIQKPSHRAHVAPVSGVPVMVVFDVRPGLVPPPRPRTVPVYVTSGRPSRLPPSRHGASRRPGRNKRGCITSTRSAKSRSGRWWGRFHPPATAVPRRPA